jgi:hypothetical protein
MSVEIKVVGSGEGEVLFILGFGVKFRQPGVKWMMERFQREEELRTTFVQLPTRIEDCGGDIMEGCTEIRKLLSDHVVIGFSMGGLIAAFHTDARRRIFLSPFWGIHEDLQKVWLKIAYKGLKHFRIRLLPRIFDITRMGHFATEDYMEGIPQFLDFHTISEMVKLQESLPPTIHDDITYWSPQDPIINHSAVLERGVEIREYQGGHMIYLVEERERIFDEIVGISLGEFGFLGGGISFDE